MQDRYAGDLGDFLKLGLLRWLVAPSFEAPPQRLGVVWYLAPDESHNADGKHVAYLDPQSSAGRQLRPLDPDLYDRLTAMVATGERSVAQLEAFGVLPAESRTFGELLHFADLNSSARVASHRATTGVDLRGTPRHSGLFGDLRRSRQRAPAVRPFHAVPSLEVGETRLPRRAPSVHRAGAEHRRVPPRRPVGSGTDPGGAADGRRRRGTGSRAACRRSGLAGNHAVVPCCAGAGAPGPSGGSVARPRTVALG